MIGLAGKYANVVSLSPWIKLSFEETREIALRAAEENDQTGELSFATVSPGSKEEPVPAKFEVDLYRNAVLNPERMRVFLATTSCQRNPRCS